MRMFVLVVALACSFAGVSVAEEAVLSPDWIVRESQLRYEQWNVKVREVNAFLNSNPHGLFVDDSGAQYVASSSSAACRDYATVKQIMLRRLGIETTTLRVVDVRSTGERHEVLFVPTAQGTLVLDSRFKEPITEEAAWREYTVPSPKQVPVSFRINDIVRKKFATAPQTPAP